MSLFKSVLLALLTFSMRSTFKRLLIISTLGIILNTAKILPEKMQDTQNPNPTILSREYITSLIRRPTLYCHHQLRLTPLSLGRQELFLHHPCTNTSLPSGEGLTKAAGAVQPHAGSWETRPLTREQLLFLVWLSVSVGQDSCLQGRIYSAIDLLLLTHSSPLPKHPSDLLHGNSQQKSAAVPLYLRAVPVRNKVHHVILRPS